MIVRSSMGRLPKHVKVLSLCSKRITFGSGSSRERISMVASIMSQEVELESVFGTGIFRERLSVVCEALSMMKMSDGEV